MRPLAALIGACALFAGCAPPPDLGNDDDAGSDTQAPPPTTSADESGSGGEGDLDPAQLDRSEDLGPCGYPGPGPNGYGTEPGQRLANNTGFVLETCDDQPVQFADLMCPRDDGIHNRGILLNIGAGWCRPCQEETLEFPELYEEFHDQGIEIVQVMFQDWDALAPTGSFCEDWTSGQWAVGAGGAVEDQGIVLTYPVLLDQVFDWTSIYLQDPEAATPVNLLIDANGNIRWKLEGQKPSLQTLRAQLNLVISDPYAPPS